jgi:hypothetical protein
MVAMFDGVLNHNSERILHICIKFNCKYTLKGFFWIFFNGFFLLILPLCSIYRHGSQDGWSEGSSDITFKWNPLRMIQAKFGLNWPSGFRGEDF